MRLLSTRIEDYGPFKGVHEFVFSDRGLTLVLGENRDEPRMNSNGSGKSSLFDALDWGTFGVVPREDNIDSVIYEFGEQARVTNYYDDDGTPMVVQRTKKRGKSMKVRYWRGEQEITTLDTKELQRRIEQDLGLDREVFHSTVLYAQQDQFDFAAATDAQRMEILTKILRMGEIDELGELAKEAARSVEAEMPPIDAQYERARGSLEILEREAQSYAMQSSEWENTRAESLRAATVQLNDYLGNIEKAKGVVAHEDSVRSMGSVFNPMGATVFDWGSFDKEINEARVLENQWREKLAATKAEGQALRIRIDKLQSLEVGATCSECEQPISQKHVATELVKLKQEREAKLGQYNREEQSLSAAVKHREEKERAKNEAREAHLVAERDLAARTKEAELQLKQIEETKDYLQKAEAHVEYLRGTMATTQAKPNPWLQKEQEYQVKRAQLQADMEALAKSRIALDEQRAYFDFWKKAFGPAGLKNYILDTRLQEMNDAANHWVKLITGGTFWVRIETQTMGRSTKRLSNKINIRVFRYNKDGTVSDRGYRTWSGGERKRVAWAIDFGLSRLIAARATKRWDVMILDEVFSHVDARGGEAVIEMLHHLKREKSSIFVVEHDAEFKSQFENRVVVRRENGTSRILEESDGKEEKEATPDDGNGSRAKAQPQRKVRRKGVPRRKPVSRRRGKGASPG